MTATDFRDRLWDVVLRLQRIRRDEGERPTQTWLARELTRRGVPIGQSAISYWFRGESEPGDLKTYVALADALSWTPRGGDGWVDPGWLAFGEDTNAPPPMLDGGTWTTMPRPEQP